MTETLVPSDFVQSTGLWWLRGQQGHPPWPLAAGWGLGPVGMSSRCPGRGRHGVGGSESQVAGLGLSQGSPWVAA